MPRPPRGPGSRRGPAPAGRRQSRSAPPRARAPARARRGHRRPSPVPRRSPRQPVRPPARARPACRHPVGRGLRRLVGEGEREGGVIAAAERGEEVGGHRLPDARVAEPDRVVAGSGRPAALRGRVEHDDRAVHDRLCEPVGHGRVGDAGTHPRGRARSARDPRGRLPARSRGRGRSTGRLSGTGAADSNAARAAERREGRTGAPASASARSTRRHSCDLSARRESESCSSEAPIRASGISRRAARISSMARGLPPDRCVTWSSAVADGRSPSMAATRSAIPSRPRGSTSIRRAGREPSASERRVRMNGWVRVIRSGSYVRATAAAVRGPRARGTRGRTACRRPRPAGPRGPGGSGHVGDPRDDAEDGLEHPRLAADARDDRRVVGEEAECGEPAWSAGHDPDELARRCTSGRRSSSAGAGGAGPAPQRPVRRGGRSARGRRCRAAR